MADAMEESPEKQDTTKDPNEGKTMLDFVKTEIGIKPEGDAQKLGKTEEEEEAEEVEDTTSIEGEEKKTEPKEGEEDEEEKKKEGEEEEEKEGEEEEEEPQAEEKAPVPYERFEEINNKYKVSVEEYEKVKPMVEAHQQIIDYCTQNQITQEQFSNLLEIQRLLNTDPQKALEKILPIVEAVQGFTGDKLPSDLQTKVDTGKMDLADAREMAKLRAQSQLGTSRFQQYQQIQQQRAQTEFQRAQVSAVNSWVESKQKTDPDFKPRADKTKPKGRYEFVYDAVVAVMNERNERGELVHVIKNPGDLTAIMEQAYQETMKSLSPMAKKPATRKPLTHNGSGSRNTEVKIENAKSMKEAIRIAAEAHGL